MYEEDQEEQREKRMHKRYHYAARAWVKPAGEQEQEGTLLDLSLGGCLIRVPNPMEFYTDTDIEVNLQSNYLAMRAIASVRRYLEGGRVVGVSFEKLTPRGRKDLIALIADLESGVSVPPDPNLGADEAEPE